MSRAAVISFNSYSSNPAAAEVRTELAGILRSDGFVRAGRMRRFLSFIVEEALAGRAGQLCEYSIGVTVYERGELFEPGLSPIVRNDARRLRQKLLEYYQRPEAGNRVVIDVPKGGYVPTFQCVSGRTPKVKANQRYLLSVQLIRVADGAELWSAEHEITLS